MNIHEATTRLSRLVERATRGEEIVIAKAGKPLVRIVALVPPVPAARLGFLRGQAVASADLKGAFADEIDTMFAGR